MRILPANHESKVDWARASSHLDERGFVLVPGVLTKTICVEIADYYIDDHRFRSRIEMARHSFGQGEYKYFNYPLPDAIQQGATSMLAGLAALIVILWLLGFFVVHVGGGLIHILLVVAVIVLVLHFVRGRA